MAKKISIYPDELKNDFVALAVLHKKKIEAIRESNKIENNIVKILTKLHGIKPNTKWLYNDQSFLIERVTCADFVLKEGGNVTPKIFVIIHAENNIIDIQSVKLETFLSNYTAA